MIDMEVSIREMRAEDAKSVCGLSGQLGYTVSEEQTRKNINAIQQSTTDAAFVLLANEEVIGWIQVFKTLRIESEPFSEIAGLVVDERYRSKGIGKQLIGQAKEWSRQQGILQLRVRCNLKRQDAHRFYLKGGFKETKQQKVYSLSINDI